MNALSACLAHWPRSLRVSRDIHAELTTYAALPFSPSQTTRTRQHKDPEITGIALV